MITKVKGEAIKEGSIPLSALANDVKNKIENAGTGGSGATPDWNAQQGKAGYIKNRTHYRIDNVTPYDERTETLYLNETISLDIEYISYKYEFIDTEYGNIIETIDLISKDTDLYTEENPYAFSAIYSMDVKIEGLIFRNEIGNGCIKMTLLPTEDGERESFDIKINLYDGYVKQLDTQYLPNTVLKTTPQTLTTSDKKQARENISAQEKLVTGVNLATINGKSLLSGKDITIEKNEVEITHMSYYDFVDDGITKFGTSKEDIKLYDMCFGKYDTVILKNIAFLEYKDRRTFTFVGSRYLYKPSADEDGFSYRSYYICGDLMLVAACNLYDYEIKYDGSVEFMDNSCHIYIKNILC